MPSAQQHRILRQVLELSCREREQARPLGDAMRALYLERLLPLIDAACDALAGPNRLMRVDRLEIDLGALPWDEPQSLHALAAERLSQALAARLAEAAVATAAHDSDRELLERFACTGTLPWWTDVSDRDLVAPAMARLLAAPAAARAVLRRLAGRPDAWRRLMPHGDAAQWDAWAAVAVADWPRLEGAPWRALAEIVARGGGARRDLAALWWPPLLAAAGLGGAGAERLIGDALDALARQQGRDAAGLWSEWREVLGRPGPALGEVKVALDRHFGAARQATHRSALADADLAACDARLATLIGRWSDDTVGRALWGRLASVLRWLPPAQRRTAAAGATPRGLAALVDAALAQGLIGPEAVADWILAATRAEADAPLQPGLDRRAMLPLLRSQARHADLAAPLQDDALQVGNAGVVLLWPFLGGFFDRLGWVVERHFVDAAAAQRAARLLHFVASGDSQPAEYQLPLCKLLCGLDLLAPIDAEEVLDDSVLAEGELLLQAVIAQAPVLREMSIAAFRGSFLLRRGRLRARDDHHLLEVEREGWDIVIERFPWRASIVRLPWMASVLQVQW